MTGRLIEMQSRWPRSWNRRIRRFRRPVYPIGRGREFRVGAQVPAGTADDLIDIGGGKRPFIPIGLKEELELYVVGLDISEAELNAAPPGSYPSLTDTFCK